MMKNKIVCIGNKLERIIFTKIMNYEIDKNISITILCLIT